MDMIQLQIEYRLKETYLDRILILQEIRHEEEQRFENDEMGKNIWAKCIRWGGKNCSTTLLSFSGWSKN